MRCFNHKDTKTRRISRWSFVAGRWAERKKTKEKSDTDSDRGGQVTQMNTDLLIKEVKISAIRGFVVNMIYIKTEAAL